MIPYAIILLLVYLFASIPWGYLIGKYNDIDIREHGSGNIGATNVRRTLGKKWGRICFFLDFLKGFLPVLAVKLLVPEDLSWALPIAAFAAVAGHIWPIYLKFKGGKGISTTAGILLAIAPWSLLAAGISWVIVFYSTRYVSLASIIAAIVLPVCAFLLNYLEISSLPSPVLGILTALSLLAIIRHRSNIKRLLNGTENRFQKKQES
jgi:glycerol-3-phosphate acyltransferase PlsY